MSKQRLGRRERMARKRKITMRSTCMGPCTKCSAYVTWKYGRKKDNNAFAAKLVCGQCRKVNQARAGDIT